MFQLTVHFFNCTSICSQWKDVVIWIHVEEFFTVAFKPIPTEAHEIPSLEIFTFTKRVYLLLITYMQLIYTLLARTLVTDLLLRHMEALKAH